MVAGVGGGGREGSVSAPLRQPLNWRDPAFYDQAALEHELHRIFDICHGCRRCFSLCQAFPTLFEAIDASPTLELDGVDKQVYWKVVEHCYLCDLCYMTKCPYVPPHPWNVDFPHLMLRAKAVKNREGDLKFRDKVLSSTETVGNIAGIPEYRSRTLRKQLRKQSGPASPAPSAKAAQPAGGTRGKVALFATCYINRNEPEIGLDLAAIFRHNGIEIGLAEKEICCGMPKFELGDLQAVADHKSKNVPQLIAMIDRGYDIVAPIPSCVLMFKQELPLMFPDDADVAKVRDNIFDPFEYLALRHKAGALRTDFKRSLGKISYHVACHLRVQNLGLKTRDILQLVPDTTVEPIERCSGHDGTYGVKREFRETSMKIAKPVIQRVESSGADFYSSDCPMAGHQIESGLTRESAPVHPLTLLRMAYGL